jgi:prepilin-type N-terminal cleavage/methylation domain-containing protein
MRSRKGFTLIELMIVILIVAVLAAVLVPMMRARIDAAKWSEARSGIGNISSGVRAYWAEHQDEAGLGAAGGWRDPNLADVCNVATDLDGKYFTDAAYALSIDSVSADGIAFTVTVTAADSLRTNAPTTPAVVSLEVEEDGTSVWTD